MDFEQILIREHQRKTIYHILAACFSMPQEELFLQLSSLAIPISNQSPETVQMMSLLRGDLDIEELKIDFAKLFVGPFKLLAPPYGSIYLEGQRQVMGTSTLDAKKRYQDAGLEISKVFKDSPDHISAELEFLYFMNFEQIEAIENSDFDSALNWLKRQEDFLQNHLGAWVAAFTSCVTEHAETDFYQTLGKTTGQFIPRDIENLKSEIIPKYENLASIK